MTPEQEKEKEEKGEQEEQVLVLDAMKRYRNGEIWDFEDDMAVSDGHGGGENGVLLGLDGGTTSTVCIPIDPVTPNTVIFFIL